MKKLLFSVVLVAFAVAAQAGDSACCATKQVQATTPSCCAKTETAQQNNATCPVAGKNAKQTAGKKVKQNGAKQALSSPKAISLASR